MNLGSLITTAAIADHAIRSSFILLLTITLITGIIVIGYVYRGKLFRKS